MRRRFGVIGIASVVALGVAVLPGSPAAAEEYDGTCTFGVDDGVFDITSGDGQAEPGGTFTLSDLRVEKDSGHGSTADVHLEVSVGDLDVQIIELGSSHTIDEGPDFGHRVWDQVPPFELDAPEGLGPHDITAELVHYDFPNIDTDCELTGGPFAEVVVSDEPPPTTTTTTTTTTVPDDNGDENGDGSLGEEAEEEAVDDVVEEITEEVAAAERALSIGAAPRFTG